MKKKVFALLLCGLPLMINAQDAFDVLQMSQTELRGTSRFQSMAGAFGALGGDISVLTATLTWVLPWDWTSIAPRQVWTR